jgi:FtsH-binding integral membrane protein
VNIIAKLIGFFTGGAGAAVSNIASLAALVAAFAPGVYWFVGHQNEIALTLTWGHVALVGGVLFFVLEIIRAANPRGGA